MKIHFPTASGPTSAQNVFNLNRLAPGDVIHARILSVSPEGRTRLQIGSAQVTANQHLGGKPGDILLFEVQPRPSAGGFDGQAKSPLLIRMLEGGRQATYLPGGISSTQTGQTQTGSSGRPAVATPSPPMPGGTQSNSQNPVLMALTATRLLGPLSSPNPRAIDKNRRQRATSALRSTTLDQPSSPPQTSCEKRTDAGTNAANRLKADLGEGAAPSDYASGFLIEAAGEEYRSAYIRLQSRKAIRALYGPGDVLTAALMLDLEKTGPLEVEVQMVEDQIWVKFKVATDTVRKDVQAGLREMHTSLKDLAEKVYCRVQVDHAEEARDSAVKTASPEMREIDFTL